VGPRAILDAVMERKIPSLRREWNPKTPFRENPSTGQSYEEERQTDAVLN